MMSSLLQCNQEIPAMLFILFHTDLEHVRLTSASVVRSKDNNKIIKYVTETRVIIHWVGMTYK